MEARHLQEVKDLEATAANMLKASKKSTRSQVEAQIIQMRYDLRAKHREEEEYLEDRPTEDILEESSGLSNQIQQAPLIPQQQEDVQVDVEKKKAKARAKQEKKAAKEKERLLSIEQSKTQSGPSLREVEMSRICTKLQSLSMQIKDIPSDGNCLYRAIADQLQLVSSEWQMDWKELRAVAARYIRNHREEYAPFLGEEAEKGEGGDAKFDDYCELTKTCYCFVTYCFHLHTSYRTLCRSEGRVLHAGRILKGKNCLPNVDCAHACVLGGQLEIQALSHSLQQSVVVYSADSPVLSMGPDDEGQEDRAAQGDTARRRRPPLRISYHKHYYALGAHYNSVVPLC
eukprot:gene27644-36453_t